ncbi:hypothetical protein [Nioella nitratireducens]|uniref:hypothetical protein n=1 Tax=Nioella nitratireducens TaxID=1287720 RepID=UPI0011BACA7A|nr:hypothetical protein [Nioella nitratireducens]
MSDVISSVLGSNGFWLFFGILVGAVVQFILHLMVQWQQRKTAKKIFCSEIEINLACLDALEADLNNAKDEISANQFPFGRLHMDMANFNYSAMGPLINSGHFHALLGASGTAAYFRFVNTFNAEKARIYEDLFSWKHKEGRSLAFLRLWIEKKIPEARQDLVTIKGQLS